MELRAENISYHYPGSDRKILDHISLCLRDGERAGLMAESGFGKTTLCRILSGYEKPDSGEVFLDGRPLSSYRGALPVQMIFQHPELSADPRKRLKKVLMEGDWGKEGIPEEILTGLGIRQEWMDRFPIEVSGGELQRFCIARALGRSTRILIADEITTMLDLITQKQIWEFLLKETSKRGISMLVVSHEEKLLEKVCDRIIKLA